MGPLKSSGDVEMSDFGVRHGAAQNRHVQRAGKLDVLGPVGLPVE